MDIPVKSSKRISLWTLLLIAITVLAGLGALVWFAVTGIPGPESPVVILTPTSNITYADFDIAFNLEMTGSLSSINRTLFASQLQFQVVNGSGALSNQIYVTNLTSGSIIAQVVIVKVHNERYPTEQLLQRFAAHLQSINTSSSFFRQYPLKPQQLSAVPVTPLSVCKSSNYSNLCGSNCANSSYCIHGSCQPSTDTCNCLTGYTDSRCSSLVDNCSPNPCQNSGVCANKLNNHTCACATGWTGINCAEVIDNCVNQPCLNNGTCINVIGNGTYICSCGDAYYGTLCGSVKREACTDYTPCTGNDTCVFNTTAPYYQCVGPFISTWHVFPPPYSTQLTLPLPAAGVYNFTAYWGDGRSSQVTSSTEAVHNYNSNGTYQIVIVGQIQGFGWAGHSLGGSGDTRYQLFEISQFGVLSLLDTGSQFDQAFNLEITATDSLNLTGITSFVGMFHSCQSLTRISDNWNTSAITNMQSMFDTAGKFNSPLLWDTSKVTTMGHMFFKAIAFNQPLHWNTQNVSVFDQMFALATSFNNDLSSFTFKAGVTMQAMLTGATSFNHPSIISWNTSQVYNIAALFNFASAFNQPIGNWEVQNTVLFFSMFSGATAFNQDISHWDVRKGRQFDNFLSSTSSFSRQNYDALLTGWWTQWGTQLQSGISFKGASSYSCNSVASSARANLTSFDMWTITDGGCV